jgi:rhodanese-related sulfurtransferase
MDKEILPDNDMLAPLIVHCVNGKQAKIACLALRKKGFLDATNVGSYERAMECLKKAAEDWGN